MSKNLIRRNGIYYARIQVDGIDRRKSLQTNDRREAERRLKAQLALVSAYHGTIRKTFDDVIADYLLDAETTLKPATHKRYMCSALQLADHFGGRWWDTITKEAVLDYVKARKPVAKIPTIKRDLTVLSQVAEYAIEHGMGGTNPVAQIGKRAMRYRTPTFRLPPAADVQTAINACYGNLKPLAHFLLATGMRLNEGVTLTWDQIDLPRSTARLTETKNSSTRTVTLSDAAKAILTAQTRYTRSRLVFPAVDRVSGDLRPYKQASTNWTEAQQRAFKDDKARKFPLHGLRHIYAITDLAHGGNIYRLQLQLGHGSIRQTEYYLQFLSPEEQQHAKTQSAQIPAHPKRFTLAKGEKNG